MLTSLSFIIQRVCHSLRVISNKELEEKTNLIVDEVIALADSRVVRFAIWPEPPQSGMVASLDTEEKSSETMGRSSFDLRQQQENHVLKGNLDSAGDREIKNRLYLQIKKLGPSLANTFLSHFAGESNVAQTLKGVTKSFAFELCAYAVCTSNQFVLWTTFVPQW